MALTAGVLTVGVDQALAQPSPGPGHSQSAGNDKANGNKSNGKSNGNGNGNGNGKSQTPTPKNPPTGGRKALAAGGPVLAASSGGTDGLPTTNGLQRELGATLQDKSLGTLNFAVADGTTGELLYGSGENTPATPASTTKLLTSLAALALIPADTRITTKVVKGSAPGEITLVGGGDPTVTGLPVDQVLVGGMPVDAETAPASLADLARQTAAALKAAGTTSVKVSFDTSLYTGPLLHKEHDAMNIAAVTPLMVDEGRIDPKSPDEAPARVFDPAGSAAEAFAGLLRAQGITVLGKATSGTAASGAQVLGKVDSPTVPRLVERLLTTSDNTLAEAVARQVAIAAHQPASFDGAVEAMKQTLEKLGVPMAGVVLHDGSGLHKGNLISPIVLAKVLALAASPQHPELRPLLTGLPIAGFTGTLVNRFGANSGAQNAAGIVRAKTGTLAGINTLAGTVVDADGRVLVFALMTKTTAGPDAARAAVDRIVAHIAGCGCR
ncbi:D-alanyl-D-alanine carboxypeptidase/D-alanyl-D-alanine endopeptidase [Kitasatospora atroaurantiaca]|uniref:D-alanyl-D-alanine carboxypeptidase/D-alanyl-D-alanine-endopeptidase (Penicillin-binding protein 4) n=1 Tax=Kitasatospora atroaurantiaca TaxID=285545 RepID=A0A561ETM9_9ACTN|nr:D-alanyl-D-alanine carboxypeptidase/D-alanyl-D-alanine-endopeptidase [Kitasatospora atroaurantiaca]TWE18957.1 D-alanyl-D-alanine carboxypeptidase/D-alanyl-D-alanine-endopeptidase (penicillin-binding protein 4) [Kitasatospora atroaurantiaca]